MPASGRTRPENTPGSHHGEPGVRARIAAWFCWLLLTLTGVPAAVAHPPVATSAIVRVDPSGAVWIDVNHDVLAFALNDTSQNIPDGPMFDLLKSPDEQLAISLQEAAERFETLCVLTLDGQRAPVKVTAYPAVSDIRAWQKSRPNYPLPVKLDLSARADFPSGSRSFTVRFPEMFGTLVLTVARPGYEPLALPLTPNELSPAFELKAADQPSPAASAEPTGWWPVFLRFTRLGFLHIIPGGPDHALFVLGLFLLSPRLKPVFLQISSFTVAHTITLTLTSLNVIGMPSSIVEPAIAASVAFVGIENLFTTKVHMLRRSAVAFVFGLVHGMGVAAAFSEAGFPPGQLVSSLAAFTVGVEAGHLAVLAAAVLTLGWWTDRAWYRRRLAIPLSLAISAVAIYWLFRRLPW